MSVRRFLQPRPALPSLHPFSTACFDVAVSPSDVKSKKCDAMFESSETVDSIAHVIQVALTPVFLLSGIASLLGAFSGRLARVADRVDALSEKLDSASLSERPRLQRRLAYLRRRSQALDIAVVLAAVAGVATCVAALLLFLNTLGDHAGTRMMFIAFGLALVSTAGALAAFLFEMLMASHGIRDQVAAETSEAAEAPADQLGSEGPADAGSQSSE